MSQRISEFTRSLKQLGEIQVTDWDFMELLHKDIKEIGPSLRKLGNRKVMDWDFKTVMPAVRKLANQEVDLVDLVGLVKQAADYKVMEWDFRGAPAEDKSRESPDTPAAGAPGKDDMQRLIGRLGSFLQFVAMSLVGEPAQVRVRVREIQGGVLRFHLVVSQKDVKDLIGRNGHSATAIRNLLKATATEHGVHALLEILSHEEDLELRRREDGRS